MPVIVDAGVGTASDAAVAMELGCHGILLNTAIAHAKKPVLMAEAMRGAVDCGAQSVPRRSHAEAAVRQRLQPRSRADRMSDGSASSSNQSSEKPPPLSSYQRRLLAFLSVASFFEGYDFFALTQILPNLRADLHVGIAGGGLLVGFINVGTILAFILARKADRWGRKPVLTATIAGYTVFTFLSGLSPNVYVFAVLQMVARIFLIAEWATSMVIAAEEFPAKGRGTVLGVVSAAAGFGAIVCAGVVPLLLTTAYGWRSVYFVSIVPLVLLAIARRGLQGDQPFQRTKAGTPSRKACLRSGARVIASACCNWP